MMEFTNTFEETQFLNVNGVSIQFDKATYKMGSILLWNSDRTGEYHIVANIESGYEMERGKFDRWTIVDWSATE